MTLPYIPKKFNIIRVRDSLNVAETVYGKRVYRREKIWWREPGRKRWVRCAPYMEHFLFEDTSHLGWTLFCTCGSPAGLTGYNAYKNDGSPTSGGEGMIAGEQMVCLHHAQFHKHLDGVG